MGTQIMARVVVAAKIENLCDLFKVNEGILSPDAVRTLDVADALVDTVGQKLIGNPEHGGEQMIEIFSYFPRSSLNRD